MAARSCSRSSTSCSSSSWRTHSGAESSRPP
eukprot:CAMPEP_0195641764 /NCGR_PEP_ID=MMETSP0815-20121206/26893_1 /TAXON_ID=97485 /ORGANISM="Prymnesium parvum, Strain Texoma1" /LENGTH=30 /DNA_ID= /DNA_START= /DNA_END= /DNA_ORIENTATION=